MSQVKVRWVQGSMMQFVPLGKSGNEPAFDTPVIPIASLAEVVEGLRGLHDFFTSNHENVGLELYGRVNGTVLTPSAQRLNELLDQTKDLLTQLEGHTKGGGDE